MSLSFTTDPINVTHAVLFSNTTYITQHSSGDNPFESIIRFLHKYYIWIVFAVGFPGNLISLFVVVRMSRYQLSTMLFYVGLLAVVDNFAIIMKILKNQDVYGTISVNTLQCKFMSFFGFTFVAYANWILVVMSVDRLAAVMFPLKVKLFLSVTRAVKIVSVVLICLCFIHSHFFITMTRYNSCSIHTDYTWFKKPWWFISASVYAVGPAVIITIINITIIYMVRRSTARGTILRSETDPLNVELRRRQRQERRVTTTLVTVAVVFVVLTLPRCIYVIWFDHWQSRQGKGYANVITANISDTNHAVNFYLYFWRGRRFRHYFLGLLPSDISKALGRCSKTTETTEDASRRTGTAL